MLISDTLFFPARFSNPLSKHGKTRKCMKIMLSQRRNGSPLPDSALTDKTLNYVHKFYFEPSGTLEK
jgi:hypothetical protein